ncbi:hypothetical protein D3C84_620010 [compost metagenome]
MQAADELALAGQHLGQRLERVRCGRHRARAVEHAALDARDGAQRLGALHQLQPALEVAHAQQVVRVADGELLLVAVVMKAQRGANRDRAAAFAASVVVHGLFQGQNRAEATGGVDSRHWR